jgi:hypothetical protein
MTDLALARRLWNDPLLETATIAKLLRLTADELVALTSAHPDLFPERIALSPAEQEQMLARQRLAAAAGCSLAHVDEIVARLQDQERVPRIAAAMRLPITTVSLIRQTLLRSQPVSTHAPTAHKPRYHLTDEQQRRIIAAYQAGEPLAKIVTDSGVGIQTIRRLVAKAGCPPRLVRRH